MLLRKATTLLGMVLLVLGCSANQSTGPTGVDPARSTAKGEAQRTANQRPIVRKPRPAPALGAWYPRVHIGMSIAAFRAANPQVVPDKVTFSEDLVRASTWRGNQGKWRLHVYRDVLTNAQFEHQGARIDPYRLRQRGRQRLRAQFSTFSAKTTALRRHLEAKLGLATRLVDRRSQHRKLQDQRYQSSLLYSAQWAQEQLQVKLTLHFNGHSNLNIPNANPRRAFNYTLETEFKGTGKAGAIPDEKFYPGMPVKALAALHPKLFPHGLAARGQWSKKEKLYDLDGSWSYTFHAGKLDWYSWSRHLSGGTEINKQNFDRCLHSARRLIDALSKLHGKPSIFKQGKTKFIDPLKQHHWGYQVIDARWVTPRSKKRVEFSFMGSKGHYTFVVQADHQRRDDPTP